MRKVCNQLMDGLPRLWIINKSHPAQSCLDSHSLVSPQKGSQGRKVCYSGIYPWASTDLLMDYYRFHCNLAFNELVLCEDPEIIDAACIECELTWEVLTVVLFLNNFTAEEKIHQFDDKEVFAEEIPPGDLYWRWTMIPDTSKRKGKGSSNKYCIQVSCLRYIYIKHGTYFSHHRTSFPCVVQNARNHTILTVIYRGSVAFAEHGITSNVSLLLRQSRQRVFQNTLNCWRNIAEVFIGHMGTSLQT